MRTHQTTPLPTPRWPTPRIGPALLAAALLYGLVEGMALCRSRVADAVHALRDRLRRG